MTTAATAVWAKGADAPTAPPTYISYESFLRQTVGEFAEWEDGKILRRDFLVSYNHTAVSVFLITLLQAFVQDNNAGTVVHAPYQMRLRAIVRGREPDVAVVLPANASRLLPNYLDGAADLAIEIVSPESIERDRQTKFAEYETAGITEYWILDPVTQTAEFYVRDAATGKYVVRAPDANGNYESAVLPGCWMSVGWLWQTPLPSLRSVLGAWAAGKP